MQSPFDASKQVGDTTLLELLVSNTREPLTFVGVLVRLELLLLIAFAFAWIAQLLFGAAP
jgi:hypothetical protein